MKKGLNVIDLFSGIGGFSLGLRFEDLEENNRCNS